MNDIKALYARWKERATLDPDLTAELAQIEGDEDAILDRFYKNLEFGTAGLRGVIGAGTNRMNVYTVGQATQGLASYLNETYDAPSVAIAYDSRIKSDTFSRFAAGVLAANGIHVYIYPELVPTPMLSFAVRYFGCKGGIILTASHNPAQYNGYKCYDPEGYQMTDEAAARTYEFIQQTDMFDDIKTMPFEEGLAKGLIEYIGDDVVEAFYREVEKACLSKEICRESDLKVIYTPLNGTGNKHVRAMLSRIGIRNVRVVKEQELPDGNFPTCPYPNPEIRQVFECGLAMTKEFPADLLLATDPDCDRVGIAVKNGDRYELMTGNEVGVLLAQYLLERRAALGKLPEKPIDRPCHRRGQRIRRRGLRPADRVQIHRRADHAAGGQRRSRPLHRRHGRELRLSFRHPRQRQGRRGRLHADLRNGSLLQGAGQGPVSGDAGALRKARHVSEHAAQLRL